MPSQILNMVSPFSIGGGNDDCVDNDVLFWLHSIFGILSMALWMVVGFPQMYSNYKNKSGESVSELFLYTWLLGDAFNIAGILLAYENPQITMLLVGAWYGLMDIVLLYQIYYYRHINKKKNVPPFVNGTEVFSDDDDSEPGNSRVSPQHLNALFIGAVSLNALFFYAQSQIGNADTSAGFSVSRQLFSLSGSGSSSNGNDELIGMIFGWISAALYIGSRFPQIYKNWSTKSTEGLSILLFIIAVAANLSYAAGIFFCNTESDYLLTSLPFIVGALGTLIFDFVIFLQFYVYSPKDDYYYSQIN